VLVEAGANLSVKNNDRLTPLALACTFLNLLCLFAFHTFRSMMKNFIFFIYIFLLFEITVSLNKKELSAYLGTLIGDDALSTLSKPHF
jgi:hypothetical protein